MGRVYFAVYDTPKHMKPTKAEKGSAVKTIREIAGMTQAEFARMIGGSLDTVKSWESNRNSLSPQFETRILLATGAGIQPDGSVRTHWRVGTASGLAGKPFSRPAFNFWRANVARSDDQTAETYAKRGAEALALVLAAAGRAERGRRDKLPSLWQSFEEWLVQVTEDFQLAPAIEQLPRGQGFYWRMWRKPPGNPKRPSRTKSKRKPGRR
jgi:transcriptional regulator with XRE-family HTH domain